RARDGAESNQWSEFCSMLDSVTLSSSSNRIFCDLNDEATRWLKIVPIKVNILAWRTRLDRLLTRVNLITRGWEEVSTYAEWNRFVFDSSPPRRAVIFDDIITTSFIWSVNRCSCSFSWEFWLKNPFLISL
nr:RNA-directed DNA polymerase, eukaryota, reverse transcriptase zinc-binding domain protein [Tanacetum cinerariifolium]